MIPKKYFIPALLISLTFTIFSYGFIPGTLTLSSNPLFLEITDFLTQFGYERTRTSMIFSLIVIILAYLYFSLFKNASRYKLKSIFIFSIILNIIFVLSFPMLSRDIFNYIFDTKIILVYHQNPYLTPASQFMVDPQTRFMTWVHQTTPYGFFWTSLSLIPALLGFGKFVLNLAAFKVFIVLFHILNIFLIYKILKKNNPEQVNAGVIFYALNPVILLEGVSSAHNDIVMMSFALLAFYYSLLNKKFISLISLALSIAIKYTTALLFPLFILYFFTKKAKIIEWGVLIFLIGLLFNINRFQVWYLIWPITLAALNPSLFISRLLMFLSIGAALRYVFYFYYGGWQDPVSLLSNAIILIMPAIFLTQQLITKKLSFKFL